MLALNVLDLDPVVRYRPGRSQQTDDRDHVDQPVLAAAGSERP